MLFLIAFQAYAQIESDRVSDLFYEHVDLSSYRNGRYEKGVKLFLFCRDDRNYPCLFVAKDAYDRPVRTSEGELWSLPALALSKYGRDYDQVNGETPQGVHRIDAVMPRPNKPAAYGRYRRLILNWIETDEQTLKLIPETHWNSNWWKQASIARDNGRKWLRIHGTGSRNHNPESSFYPLIPTSGCISTREGTYEGTEYNDQRELLDTLMIALELEPNYENERKIFGLLYVINLDSVKKAVSLQTLREYGID